MVRILAFCGKGDIDIGGLGCVILLGMSKEVAKLLCKALGGVVAMVLIWRLVIAALAAGLDGIIYMTGLAAIAGLGGYEIRWLVDSVKHFKTPDKE